MTAIHEQADPSTFGYDFNYAVWSPNTQVTLCNVPWGSDYRDIVDFATNLELDNYLFDQTGPSLTIDNMTYAQVGKPIRLNVPFHNAYNYNYLRAYNPAQPVPGNDVARAFYYFITDVQYIAPNNTQITIQLDVWQSFGRDVTFGNCYVERGHIGIANENAFDHYGRDYLTVPEGLDIGGEYVIADTWSEKVASGRQSQLDNQDYDILIWSTVALNADPGTEGSPNIESATGSNFENLPNGAEIYAFRSLDGFMAFMDAFSKTPWVTQGIISVMAVPPLDRYSVGTTVTAVNGVAINELNPGPATSIVTPMQTGWRDNIDLGRYSNLKKFLTYPYCVLEMTSHTGTPIIIKPESWQSPDAEVLEIPHYASSSARVMFAPLNYNGPDFESHRADPWGIMSDNSEFLDMATGILNFPTFSIVNDGYISFMASNASGIAFQHQSADWSQQKAMVGNQLAFDQASRSIDTSRNVTGQGINAATAQTQLANETAGYEAIRSGVGGVASGLARGGPLGAVGGLMGAANSAAGYAIGVNQRNQSLGISNALASGVNQAQTGNQAYQRDTNKNYADYAAQGDYQNTIASINAKVQDAKLTQPSTSGQVGGDAFNLARYQWGYDVKVKLMQPAAMAAVGEYWLRYGYAVNRFKSLVNGFSVMSNFTYWKLRETYIISSTCPETFKQSIRGIFEKGVTVWNNPNDMGVIDIANNNPLPGVNL